MLAHEERHDARGMLGMSVWRCDPSAYRRQDDGRPRLQDRKRSLIIQLLPNIQPWYAAGADNQAYPFHLTPLLNTLPKTTPPGFGSDPMCTPVRQRERLEP